MAPLTNGARVKAFPSGSSQLNVIAVLVNYPQTRKSQMTKLAKEIGVSLDSHVLKVLKEAVQAHRTSQERPAHEDAPEIDGVIPNVRSARSALCSFTPEELFQRCSGDAAHGECG